MIVSIVNAPATVDAFEHRALLVHDGGNRDTCRLAFRDVCRSRVQSLSLSPAWRPSFVEADAVIELERFGALRSPRATRSRPLEAI
jgi:hypothetical protein